MRQLRAWLMRIKGLFLKDARERELADELESHLQMHIDDNIRAGMSPQEARRVAVMKLGGVDQTKEAYRDRATIPFVESIVQDLRFTFSPRAARCVRRSDLRPARGVIRYSLIPNLRR